MNRNDCIHIEACLSHVPRTFWDSDFYKGCNYFKDKNKIIELPKLDFGQDVWIIYKGRIKHLKVTGLNFKACGPEKEKIPMKYGHFDILLWLGGFTWNCTVNDIGKTVFLSKADAENKLKGGKI